MFGGGGSFRCKYMPRLYSHLREYRKRFLGNYLCIGFVPGGNQVVKALNDTKVIVQQGAMDTIRSLLDTAVRTIP